MPNEKCRWLTPDLINTTSTQFGAVIISLSVLCKALPQARCEREGDRRMWGRPKWTTYKRHEFWPQKLGRSSWSFGWGVSQRSSNGRMAIILGGGNPSTKAWWRKLCSVVGKAGWMAGPLGWRHITKILKYLEIHGWNELSAQFHIDDWSPGQPDPGQGTLSHACYVGGAHGSPSFPIPSLHPQYARAVSTDLLGSPELILLSHSYGWVVLFISVSKISLILALQIQDDLLRHISTVWVVLKIHSVES